jgi:hypothetical protein
MVFSRCFTPDEYFPADLITRIWKLSPHGMGETTSEKGKLEVPGIAVQIKY